MFWDSMPDNVKKHYSWNEGVLYAEKKKISNYYVKPVKYLNSPSHKKEYLLIQYFVGESEEKIDGIVEIIDGRKIALKESLDCVTFRKTAINDLETLIKLQLPSREDSGWYIDSVGWHNLNSSWIYCFGKEIFPKKIANKVYIDSELSQKFILGQDYQLTDRKTLNLICQLIQFNNVPITICFLYLVTSLIRSLYFAKDIPPRFVLYIHGKSETYKTTIAKYFFDIYSKHDGTSFAVEDLTSSSAALQTRIDEFKDCVFILDDLSDGLENNETRRKKSIVNDFIRTAANCEKRLTKSGNSIRGEMAECSIAITAEYTLDLPSIVNRTIALDMDKYPISSEILDFFSDNERLMASFARMFIAWACQNTDHILERIEQGWKKCREKNLYPVIIQG